MTGPIGGAGVGFGHRPTSSDRLDELCLSISPLMGGDPLPVAVTPPGAGLTTFVLRNAMVEDSTLFLRYERQPKEGEEHG